MNTVTIFPGMSARNREWLNEMQKHLELQMPDSKFESVDYSWWKNNDTEVSISDMNSEVEKLDSSLVSRRGSLVAKSIGSYICGELCARDSLKPACAIFMGLPLKYLRNEAGRFTQWLQNVDFPVLILQNTEDPAASIMTVRNMLGSSSNNVTIEERPGTGHSYDSYKELSVRIAAFIESASQNASQEK